MSKRILLLTKDALCKEYLPTYGNSYWKGKTPNLDELAQKGTVFTHFYTSAPSTVMAFRSIVTGKFPHEQPYSDYIPLEVHGSSGDLFNYAKELGYRSYLLWDSKWEKMVLRYGNCFGSNLKICNIDGLNQDVGVHCKRVGALLPSLEKENHAIESLMAEVDKICRTEKSDLIMWIHLPHVIMGRTGYGTDIDVFDKCLGRLRAYFDDDSIFVSADHGNMNGYHGKFTYGFDAYTPAVEIPLITPRIQDMDVCDAYLSNVDLKEILLEKRINEREVIFADTAYYAQPHRKLLIIYNNFAYIYSKLDGKEELYDLENDPFERFDFFIDKLYDVDRKLWTDARDVYFSPHWDNIEQLRADFRQRKNEVWRNGNWWTELRGRWIFRAKTAFVILRKWLKGH